MKKKLFVMFLAMILVLAIPAAAFAEPDEPGTTPSAKAYRVINEVTNAGISQIKLRPMQTWPAKIAFK